MPLIRRALQVADLVDSHKQRKQQGEILASVHPQSSQGSHQSQQQFVPSHSEQVRGGQSDSSLPFGWIQQWDSQHSRHFYVNTSVQPPVSSWVHPSAGYAPPSGPPPSTHAVYGQGSHNPQEYPPQYTQDGREQDADKEAKKATLRMLMGGGMGGMSRR